jgi:chaperone modulatory protein CbpM
MIGFEAVIRIVGGLEAEELQRWIAERWVLPETGAQGYVFAEVDVARVRLIHELRHELAIDEEAIPVVLQLLDQVYALRRRLRVVLEAIDVQPPAIREALLARIESAEE